MLSPWLAPLLALPASLASGPPEVGPVPAALRDARALDPFYVKHTAVAGFPILGSERVSDAALREAAWIVRRVLAERDDVLAALAGNGVHLVVMAHDEYTTDVPEHRELSPRVYWDRRARGLGGAPVSCAEENLLGFPGDPYSTENILIHEFAHIVHAQGAGSLDPTLDPRLEVAYDAALERGLWEGTYAATNREEYWAEGVQSWFDDNRQDDALHNHVDTRVELRAYDPGLAALCEEVFGDGAWRYEKPLERSAADRAHLADVDFESLPRFEWREEPVAARPRVSIQTAFGNVEVELQRDVAPASVAGFLRDVQRGRYADGKLARRRTAGGTAVELLPADEPEEPSRERLVIVGDPPEFEVRVGGAALGRVIEGAGLVRSIRGERVDEEEPTSPPGRPGSILMTLSIQRAIRMN